MKAESDPHIMSVTAVIERLKDLCPIAVECRYDPTDPDRQQQARDWCTEQYGEDLLAVRDILRPEFVGTGRWYNHGLGFRFASEQDAFWFKMRWG